MSLFTLIKKATPEEIITDVDLFAKKCFKHQRHFYVINILKELVRATIITKHILDLGVSLTVRELLVLAQAVEK